MAADFIAVYNNGYFAYGGTPSHTQVYTAGWFNGGVVADFIGNPRTGCAPLVVSFTDLTNETPTSWLWNFGDGTTSTEQNPDHAYARPGVYRITLTVVVLGTEYSVTKNDYINVSFCDCLTKYTYVNVTASLKTLDIAPPLHRTDLRHMYRRGEKHELFIENGIRFVMYRHVHDPDATGFKRPQGPSLIFD